MGYGKALMAAGATIIDSKTFGSYQGDALFFVKYERKEGWIVISYGSCCGCDAFEAEFFIEDEDKPDYKERLAAFGADYLTTLLTKEEVLAKFKEQAKWDVDAQDIIKYVTEFEE